jgi:predicted Zn-dependent protease
MITRKSHYPFYVLPLALTLLLTACATTDKDAPRVIQNDSEATAQQAADQLAMAQQRETRYTDKTNATVASLLKQARYYESEGQLLRAASLIERSVRIQPKNPLVWQHLAEVRLAQGDFGQAEQLALKSNALAGADDEVKLKNWKIIARARQQQDTSASLAGD